MMFNPILDEGKLAESRPRIRGRAAASRRLEMPAMPGTVVVLERASEAPAGDRLIELEPGGGSGSADLSGFDRYYLIDLREHVVTWEIPIATANSVVHAVVIAALAVSSPAATVAEHGVRDAAAATSASMERALRPVGQDVQAGDFRVTAAQMSRDLVGHRFECGLEVRWINVTFEPAPELAEHLAKIAEQEREHELAMRRIDLEQVRIEREASQGARRRELEHIRRTAQQAADQVGIDATRDAEQIRRLAHEAAEQVRIDAAREAEQIRRTAQEAAEQLRIEAADDAEQIKRSARKAVSADEISDAARLNQELAAHPGKMMGYLLAMDDTTSVREAIKVLEERERAAWSRLKELEKLKLLGDDDIRALAFELLSDPAGGAFGLDVGTALTSRPADQSTAASPDTP